MWPCYIVQAKVHRRPFFRDVGCFILAVTCLLFVVLNQGAVYRWEAILLLVLYFVYVAGMFRFLL
jgi:Ca2+/Na+ antiporter